MSNVGHPSLALNPGASAPTNPERLLALVSTARQQADAVWSNAENLVQIGDLLVSLARGEKTAVPQDVCQDLIRANADRIRRSMFTLTLALRSLDTELDPQSVPVVLSDSFAPRGR
jgi:hypothetical protein